MHCWHAACLGLDCHEFSSAPASRASPPPETHAGTPREREIERFRERERIRLVDGSRERLRHVPRVCATRATTVAVVAMHLISPALRLLQVMRARGRPCTVRLPIGRRARIRAALPLAVCVCARGAEAPRSAPVGLQLLQALVDGSGAGLPHVAVAVVALHLISPAFCLLQVREREKSGMKRCCRRQARLILVSMVRGKRRAWLRRRFICMARCITPCALAVVLAVCVCVQLLQALVDGSSAGLPHVAVAVVALHLIFRKGVPTGGTDIGRSKRPRVRLLSTMP